MPTIVSSATSERAIRFIFLAARLGYFFLRFIYLFNLDFAAACSITSATSRG